MQMSLTFPKFAALTTGILLLAAASHGAQGSYEYDWIGGAPGFSGKIFLDAPTSAASPTGGTIADVLPGSYLTTPLDNFSLFNGPLSSEFIGTMQWDQTHISDMFLLFDSATPVTNPAYGLPAVACAQAGYFGVANGLEAGVIEESGAFATAFANDDFSGQWELAAAPEPTSFALAGLGGMALMVFQRRAKRADRV